MALLDRFMPRWSVRQVDRVAVAPEPAEAFAAVDEVDAADLWYASWLFQARLLPERISARLQGKSSPLPVSLRLTHVPERGVGFLQLGRRPEREVVIGAIGKFWQSEIEYAVVDPSAFASFAKEGFGKLAWCLRVDPRAGGGSWIGVDLRVDATDAESLDRFRRYWRRIGPFSHAIRRGLLAQFVRDLGSPAVSDESRPIDGDGLLPDARWQRTRAIVIEAPPSQVWPWLAQMGAGRAGWYAIDWLDNGGVPSASRIVPELQHLSVGELVHALPHDQGGFAVLRFEPERTLVLGSPTLSPDGPPAGVATLPWQTTWAFVLEPIGTSATHLVVRVRADYEPSVRMTATRWVLGAAHEVMESAQLRHLKRRAEMGSMN